jgi:formate/nitrite transporter FocA (FNT family)
MEAARAGGKIRTRDLVSNWVIAFAGNAAGAFMTAILTFYSTQYTFGSGAWVLLH